MTRGPPILPGSRNLSGPEPGSPARGIRRPGAKSRIAGHAHGCAVQIRLDSAGLMIVARPKGSDRHAATIVPWPDVVAHNGAVTAAMNAMVAEAAQKGGKER